MRLGFVNRQLSAKEPIPCRPLRRVLNRPGGLLVVSLVLAIAMGLLTSSLFGFGLFLVLPSLVARFARR